MSTIRKIKKVIIGQESMDGAGVKLNRIFGYSLTKLFDPFLMLDYFDSRNPKDYIQGFPWHPHRGIETVTYILDGAIEHQDSLGNKGIISGGDLQWMTAGSGIIHQEMPQASEYLRGIQLWVNLPKKYKMTPPVYKDITQNDISTVKENGYKVKIIAGKFNGIEGPLKGIAANPTFLDVELEKGSRFKYATDENETVFAFVFSGTGIFSPDDKTVIEKGSAVLYEKGSYIEIESVESDLRFIVICGKPLEEPIAWSGPIVMNTDDELGIAFRELEDGSFIK